MKDDLKHHGIKGMQWGKRRTPEEIKLDIQNGAGAAGEALEDAGDEVFGNDSITEELGDVIDVIFGGKGNLKKEYRQLKDAVKDKLEDVGSDIKKRGKNILTKMFGESKNTRKVTTTNNTIRTKN